MVFDDLVVEVAKDALVVVDQPEEASSNVAKFTLANGETGGYLTLTINFSNDQNEFNVGKPDYCKDTPFIRQEIR